MDWRIFSEQEVRDFVAAAKQHGFVPTGPLNLRVETPTIHWGGRDYTFAWLCLQKSR
jgi:hypothetical protein